MNVVLIFFAGVVKGAEPIHARLPVRTMDVRHAGEVGVAFEAQKVRGICSNVTQENAEGLEEDFGPQRFELVDAA